MKSRFLSGRKLSSLTKEQLYDLYWLQGLSDAKIASLLGVTRIAILQKRRTYAIQARTDSEALSGERNPMFGRHLISSPETNRKKACPGELNPFYGKHHKDNTRKLLRESAKVRCLDPSYAAQMVTRLMKQPTASETILTRILRNNFPNEWKYVGDGKDGTAIGGRVPDFINVNGHKAVIQVGRKVRAHVEHYLSYGFKCLNITNKELNDTHEVIAKIALFRDSLC